MSDNNPSINTFSHVAEIDFGEIIYKEKPDA
mgnify:CR=1 FL=1